MSPKQHSLLQIVRSTGLLSAVQVIYVLLSMIRTKIASIFIGSEGIGLIDLYSRAITMVSTATNFGLATSAVQHLSPIYKEHPGLRLKYAVCVIRTWVMLTAILGTVGLLVFSWVFYGGKYAPQLCMLAPIVGFTAITGGETAILKATHRLRRFAYVTLFGALGALLAAAVGYPVWGLSSILAVMLISAFVLMAVSLYYGNKCVPYCIRLFSPRFLRRGVHLLRLGGALILAGVMGSLAEILIRSNILEVSGSEAMVGFFSAGVTLTVSYLQIVFSALDADFFPRLSAVRGNMTDSNALINHQTVFLVLLMTPLLIVFALFLPIIVIVLYKTEFLCIVPMVTVSLAYMFFKAVYTPAAYLPLAHADSVVFILMELGYNVFFVLSIVCGYHYGGLVGAGWGMAAVNLCDLIAVTVFYGAYYHFRFERSTIVFCVLQFVCLVAGLVCAWQEDFALKLLGLLPFALSLWLSWREVGKDIVFKAALQKFIPKRFLKPRK
ncbi:MAG: oligosaccharide flippase family protein [Bacteroidaceae bacterium]|nr:oligosaccharide flippase family protein [Bacteroidaceae bacterium]